jgi:TolB-like protein/Flp pilus assembly protein TadD
LIPPALGPHLRSVVSSRLHQGPALTFEQLIREVHRRSLWQVLGIYLVGCWVVFEVVQTATEGLGLPEWFPAFAALLLLIGLPVVLATAFVQEGVGPGPDAPAGGSAPDTRTPAPTSGAESVFTWRNATMGGVAALALGTVVGLAAGFYGGRSVSAPGAANVTDASTSTSASASTADPTYVDPAEDPRPAIAVLPFADMSPEGDQKYFSDGISEEILTVLSKIRDLRVAARSSAFAYGGRDLDLRQVGEELGVPYLLGGSVRKDGDQIRVSAELVNVADGFRMWTETYDRKLEGIFAIQSEIAESIAESLRVPLGLSSGALVSATADMDAHDLYLSGRAALRRRGPGVAEAVGLFEAAVARDSMWAPAWAGLAESRAIHPLYTGLGRESTDSAFWAQNLAAGVVAARRALELDPRNASAHIALGSIHRDRWEWEASERELLLALELDPDNEEAHIQYGELLWGMGRLDESLRETGRALALDRTPLTLDVHGFVMFMNGRTEEAEALLEEGIAIDTAGDMHFLRTVLANLMLFDGRYQEALDRFAFYLPDTTAFRLHGLALETGDPSVLAVEGYPRGLAQTWAVLGQDDRALDILEAMVFALPFRVQYDIWDPAFASLWDSPRFREVILPRVGLEGVVPSFAAPPDP